MSKLSDQFVEEVECLFEQIRDRKQNCLNDPMFNESPASYSEAHAHGALVGEFETLDDIQRRLELIINRYSSALAGK